MLAPELTLRLDARHRDWLVGEMVRLAARAASLPEWSGEGDGSAIEVRVVWPPALPELDPLLAQCVEDAEVASARRTVEEWMRDAENEGTARAMAAIKRETCFGSDPKRSDKDGGSA